MTQPAKAQEPSMEEILASIRRIIADDDASKSTQKAPEPPVAVEPASPPPAPKPLAPAPPQPSAQAAAEEPAVVSAGLQDNPQEEAADILDLTESMEAPAFGQSAAEPGPAVPPPARPPQFRKIEAHSDVGFDEGQPVSVRGAADSGRRESEGERGQLLSGATTAAVDSAFNTLAQTVLVQNARTLEDLVREMLRPLLKGWLDDNLPGMVERLVRAEIERVARGR
jgi:cell pole-organizing protein PopZ